MEKSAMLENQALGKLFYELANENRLGILCELQSGELRLLEIARKLDMTTRKLAGKFND